MRKDFREKGERERRGSKQLAKNRMNFFLFFFLEFQHQRRHERRRWNFIVSYQQKLRNKTKLQKNKSSFLTTNCRPYFFCFQSFSKIQNQNIWGEEDQEIRDWFFQPMKKKSKANKPFDTKSFLLFLAEFWIIILLLFVFLCYQVIIQKK